MGFAAMITSASSAGSGAVECPFWRASAQKTAALCIAAVSMGTYSTSAMNALSRSMPAVRSALMSPRRTS